MAVSVVINSADNDSNGVADDVDALARVAYAEANDIFVYYKNHGASDADAAAMSYGMVIDIVINRIASGSTALYGGTTVSDVLNKEHAFSSVPVEDHVGDWTQVAAVNSTTLGLVQDYLLSRATGAASIVNQATEYLNPTTDTGVAGWNGTLPGQGWGQSMLNMKYFGVDPVDTDGTIRLGDNLYTHIVGNANNLRPDPYTVSYDGHTSGIFHIAPDQATPYMDMPTGTTPLDFASPLPEVLTSVIQPDFANAISAASPLVIDLSSSHSGVTLTTWNASSTDTFFDLNDNGFAVQTAWVSGDTGLLARDLNSNGKIDSSAELFGSPTVDGFAKLAALDTNHDLRIDHNDADWSSLVVWTDTNGDAVTQSGELHSLASLNIASIDLAGVAASTTTISGNPISHTSKVTFDNGDTAAIDDAWFKHDNTNSYYTGDYTLDVDAMLLPGLRGYGTLPDLTVAMSQDSDLKDLVSDFVSNFGLSSFADAAALNAAITDILYKWAGISDVDPESRGPNIDAQHLEFVEHLVGTDFLSVANGSPSDPYPAAAELLDHAFQNAFDMLAADLLLQAGAGSLFSDAVTYNPSTGTANSDVPLSETAIADLADIAPAPGATNVAFWEAVGRFIDNTRGFSNLTVDEVSWLDSAVNSTDGSLHWSDVLHVIASDTPGNIVTGTSGADSLSGGSYSDTINGNAGNDVVHGNGGNDTISGGDDADTLYGDTGNDTLYGGDGNDVLYGGDGNDTLSGGAGANTLDGGLGGNNLHGEYGNDSFIYSGGNDVIDDMGGTDTIYLPSGVTLGDLTITRVSSDGSVNNFWDLLIQIDGSGSIQLKNQLYAYGAPIETIAFADSSTLSLSTLTHPDAYLTAGNDGAVFGESGNFAAYGLDGNDVITFTGGGNHTIDGGLGNDSLTGGTGDDIYIASPGFDTISESGGNDTIVIPAAFDIDDVTLYRINNAYGPTNDLGISINGLGQIDISSQLYYYSAYAVEHLHFLSDNSTITLTDLTVTTLGTAGNDNLSPPLGNAGANDIFDGREGDDSLSGGAGNDTYIFSAGHDIINETSGDDTIKVRDSYSPGDISIAFVEHNYADTSLQLTDSDGNTIIVSNDTYSSGYAVEHVAFADSTVWDISSMEIETHGTNGNDYYLNGHDTGDASSNDTIYGYDGDDTLSGGNGDDVLYGGDGNDTLSGNAGTDILHGGAGADTLYGEGDDILYGDGGADVFHASGSTGHPVTMYGGDGDDTFYAGSGTNIIDGGAGANTIYANSDVDDIVFNAASAFSGLDTVQGFSAAGGDKLDISNILDGHFTPGTDDITHFVQITTSGSHSEVYVDVTGSSTFGSAQHIAELQYVTGLTDEAALVTAGTLIAA